jgi:hypothetical protein
MPTQPAAPAPAGAAAPPAAAPATRAPAAPPSAAPAAGTPAEPPAPRSPASPSAAPAARSAAAEPETTPAAVSGPTATLPVEPAITRLLARHRDALGRSCELQQVATGTGPLRYLACGVAGLWIVRVNGDDAAIVDIRDLGGSVGPFFTGNHRLWVEVRSVRAQEVSASAEASPLTAAAPVLPPAAPAQAAWRSPVPDVTAPAARPPHNQPSTPQPVGRIVARDDQILTIVHPGTRWTTGTHVAFVSDPDLLEGEEQVFAVGNVVKSRDGRADVAIGMNEIVPDDANAQLTYGALTGGVFAPPRVGNVWEMSFLARPFLVLENLGVGALLDGHVGYRFRAPLHVAADLTPFAAATARAGAAAALAVFVSGSYDSQLFEVGVGAGAQTVNQPEFGLEAGSGLLLAQRLRLGARDGAHLMFQSYVALFHSNFQFSSLRVEGQIPLGARAWMRLAGSAGTLGVGFGEVGLRALLSGNGGPGSFFLTTVFGWAHLFRDCSAVLANGSSGFGVAASSCEAIDYNGPMVGAGGEFRL